MSVFDVTLNAVQAEVEVREPENAPAHAQVTHTIAQALPTPQGMVGIPIGAVRFLMDKNDLSEFITKLQEAHDQLPDPTNLALASDMTSVAQMAEQMKKVTGT